MYVILPDREDVEEPAPRTRDNWDLHIQDMITFQRESLQI